MRFSIVIEAHSSAQFSLNTYLCYEARDFAKRFLLVLLDHADGVRLLDRFRKQNVLVYSFARLFITLVYLGEQLKVFGIFLVDAIFEIVCESLRLDLSAPIFLGLLIFWRFSLNEVRNLAIILQDLPQPLQITS